MTSKPDVRVRRAYDEDQDGKRVLADRIWPTGIRKADAHLDGWSKDVAPSTALRKRYRHDPVKLEELTAATSPTRGARTAEALKHLRELADRHRLRLLTATKHPDVSEAAVLAGLTASTARA